MRILFLAAVLGAIMTTATAADEPKKEQPKKMPDPNKRESYKEKLSLRKFANGQLAKNPTPNILAFRWEKDGQLMLYTRLPHIPTKGSEFTDEKGNVYVVGEVVEATQYNRSTVKLKPKN